MHSPPQEEIKDKLVSFAGEFIVSPVAFDKQFADFGPDYVDFSFRLWPRQPVIDTQVLIDPAKTTSLLLEFE